MQREDHVEIRRDMHRFIGTDRHVGRETFEPLVLSRGHRLFEQVHPQCHEQHLHRARSSARRGMSATELAQSLEVDSLALEPVLETLVSLDWIGRVNEVDDEEGTRYILLADAEATSLEPLMRHLLLPHSEATAKLWKSGRLSAVYLKDVV